MIEPLLTVRDLEVSYGAVQVLFGVDIDVHAGEIVCVIGPNGAGKSTVIKAVIGLVPAQKGSVVFDGRPITSDNLEMGAFLQRDAHKRREAVQSVFDQFPRLYERRHQPAGKLSGGEQQMLAIGRALMMNPRLVILDEPSLGLSPKYVDLIYEKLLDLRRQGRTLLMVEQNAARALELSDRGYALELGHNRFADTGAKLLANEDVRRMYLGGA
jgi:branched-chain amino acid transport system ATP-binding protein